MDAGAFDHVICAAEPRPREFCCPVTMHQTFSWLKRLVGGLQIEFANAKTERICVCACRNRKDPAATELFGGLTVLTDDSDPRS